MASQLLPPLSEVGIFMNRFQIAGSSETTLDEMLTLLDWVRCELSDRDYERARAILLSGKDISVHAFDAAVGTAEMSAVITYFQILAETIFWN